MVCKANRPTGWVQIYLRTAGSQRAQGLRIWARLALQLYLTYFTDYTCEETQPLARPGRHCGGDSLHQSKPCARSGHGQIYERYPDFRFGNWRSYRLPFPGYYKRGPLVEY